MQIRGNAIRGGIKDRTAYHVNGGPERRGPPGARRFEFRTSTPILELYEYADPKNHALPVVRSPGRRGRHVLHFYFQELEIETVTRYGDAGPGPKGSVMIDRVRSRQANVRGAERRPAVPISTRQSRSSSTAMRRRRWTSIGNNSPPAARKSNAAGWWINMACRGKLCPRP